MMSDPNPYIDGPRAVLRLLAQRSPFYATVVQVSGAEVEVVPIGQAASLGLCAASDYVVATAAPGDTVVCIPVAGSTFVLAIRAV